MFMPWIANGSGLRRRAAGDKGALEKARAGVAAEQPIGLAAGFQGRFGMRGSDIEIGYLYPKDPTYPPYLEIHDDVLRQA